MKVRYLLIYGLFLMILSACNKSNPTSTLAPFITNVVPAIQHVGSNFEIVDCSTLNNQQTSEGNQPSPDANNDNVPIQCGYLTVPEDRRLSDGPTLKIAVTVIQSTRITRQPDPLVIVSSGSSLSRGRYFGPVGVFGETIPDRDIILFDVRGTGRSQPAYNCPEYSDLSSKMVSENLTMAQWENGYVEASLTCRDRMVDAGANLPAYTSVAVAADMEDLRQALGYVQWNIYASSYGTRIALTLMQNYPHGLRSVVLDSTWPLQVNSISEQAVNAEQVLNAFFRYCTEDDQCNQYYPQVKEYFYEVVDALNAQPITVHTANLNSGALLDIVLDGNRFLDFVLSIVSSSRSEQLSEVPRMIYQIHGGKDAVLSELLGQTTGYNRFSGGVEQLMLCNDEAGFNSYTSATTVSGDVDIRTQRYFEIVADANSKACEQWEQGSTPATRNEPAVSNVPVLLLASDLNWRIPVSWTTLAAQTLSHAYTTEFAGTGQTVSFSRNWSDCANNIMEAFITNPNAQPDMKCASVDPDFVWITLP